MSTGTKIHGTKIHGTKIHRWQMYSGRADVYVEEAVFFAQLQDLGVDMNDKQRADYEKNKEKKRGGGLLIMGGCIRNCTSWLN
jgi:hypothetical protein